MAYGSQQGRYHPNAARASGGTFEPPPERVEVPDTPDIVSFVLTPTGRRTKAFQIFDHPPVNTDGKADCIIFTKNGLYLPLEHYLSTVPVVVTISAAPVAPAKRPRPKGKPAAKTTAARKPAAKTTAAAKTPARRAAKP